MSRLRGVLALLLVAVGVALMAPPARAADPTRYLILGDSTTQGRSGDYTWRYFFWNSLTAAGLASDFVGPNSTPRGGGYADPRFDRDHEARWGRMALDAQREWPARKRFWFDVEADMTSYRPDVIIDLLGLNDLWLDDTPAGAARLIDSQRYIVQQARSQDPEVDFVIAKIGHRWQLSSSGTYNRLLEGLRKELSTSTSRIVLVEPTLTRRDTRDGTHPTAAGEMKLAEAVRVSVTGLGIHPGAVTGPPRPERPTVTRRVHQRYVTVSWRSTGTARYRVWLKRDGEWSLRTMRTTRIRIPRLGRPQRIRVQTVTPARRSARSRPVAIPRRVGAPAPRARRASAPRVDLVATGRLFVVTGLLIWH